MAVQVQHRRSGTASKRPTAANLLQGEIAVNFNNGTSGLFLKDDNGDVRKIGPAEVGGTAPNASPAAGGSTGNSTGELWFDTANSGGNTEDLLRIFNGTSFVPVGTTTVGTTDIALGGSSTTLAGLTDVSTSKVTFTGATSGNFALQSASSSDSTTYTWPAADGTANFVLATDGSGTLSWQEARTNDVSQGDSSVNVTDTGSNGTITFTTDGTSQWVINNDGDFVAQNAAQDIGTSGTPVDNVYVNTLTLTNDLATQHGGTGLDGSSAANGTLLIGNGSGYTLTTLTEGEGIDIANASGSITLSAELASDTNKGVASFDNTDFVVSTGVVTLHQSVAQSVNTDGSAATPSNSAFGILGGTGLTSSASGADVTVALDDTAVTAASYGADDTVATFTVDQQGRLTAAADVTIDIAHTQVNDFDAGVRTNTLDQMAAPTASVDFNAQKLTGLANPTNDQDAATKVYVDNAVEGLDVKDSVSAATTADLGTVSYANGSSGVGATLTNGGTQAAFAIDNVTLSAGERVLVKNQSTELQNGIYTVTTVGDGASNWVLTRTVDADESDELAGAFVFVEKGDINSEAGFVCTNNSSVTIGTDAVTWSQFSGAGQITAGTGMTKSGNTLNVNGTADRITANADTIDIASTYVGQTSITTLGTISTGTWNGTIVGTAYGGSGADGSNQTASFALMAPNGSDGNVSYREILTSDIAPTTGGSFDGGTY